MQKRPGNAEKMIELAANLLTYWPTDQQTGVESRVLATKIYFEMSTIPQQ